MTDNTALIDAAREAMAKVPVSPFVPVKATGKQMAFMANMQREALYGGTTRSMKSWAALMAVLQFACVPGYAAIIFRRERASLKLPGGLIPISQGWLADKARWSGEDFQWTFPSGATLNFGYIQNSDDLIKYQSSAYQCVAPDTPIVMADGSLKRIDSIETGELVQTLEGPRRVLHSTSMGTKPSVAITTSQGTVVCAEDHALMDGSGAWVYPRALWSNSLGTGRTSSSMSARTTPSALPRPLVRWLGRRQVTTAQQARWWWVHSLVTAALRTGDRIGCRAFGRCIRALRPPVHVSSPGQSGRRLPRRRLSASVSPWTRLRGDADFGAETHSSPPSWQDGCSDRLGRDDVRLLRASVVDLRDTRRPADVGAPFGERSLGGQARTPRHTPRTPLAYTHPYTTKQRALHPVIAENLHEATVEVVRVGARALWDVTVEESNHYITASGIVHANCILFEEVAEFPTDTEYRFMFSRLTPHKDAGQRLPRCKCHGWSVADVPLRMRATANPGGPGQAWVRQNFIMPYRAGVKGIFHPASYKDNPFIDHEEYEASVAKMKSIDRARALGGDWDITAPGERFSRDWFLSHGGETRMINPHAKGDHWKETLKDLSMVRRWDLATTKPNIQNRDPDWTVGFLIGYRKHNGEDEWYLIDVERFRATAGDRNMRMRRTSERDDKRYKRRVPVRIEREPGALARTAVKMMKAQFFSGMNFRGVSSKVKKENRIDSLAAAAEDGEVWIVSGEWNEPFLDEADAYGHPGVHDDQLDAAAGAMSDLGRGGSAKSSGRQQREIDENAEAMEDDGMSMAFPTEAQLRGKNVGGFVMDMNSEMLAGLTMFDSPTFG